MSRYEHSSHCPVNLDPIRGKCNCVGTLRAGRRWGKTTAYNLAKQAAANDRRLEIINELVEKWCNCERKTDEVAFGFIEAAFDKGYEEAKKDGNL